MQGGHADARRQHALVAAAVQNTQSPQILAEAVGDEYRTVLVRVGQNGRELFPAVPGCHVTRPPHRLLQALADGLERCVAGLVAVEVVVRFEPVDIDQQQAEGPLVA